MDAFPAAGLAAAVGYACGSIPFAWIAVRVLKGVDVRTLGSGNVGATNAARALGRPWFLLVFALDAAKGFAPVALAGPLFHPPAGEAQAWVPAAAATAAILGHLFPVWLRFRGGKGVATGAGAVLGMAPAACAVGLAAFVAVAGISRMMSLGSVAAAVAAPLAFVFFLNEGGSPAQRVPVGAFLVTLAILVLVRHVPNFRRIAAGTEPRIGQRPAAAPPPAKENPRAP